MLQKSQRVRRTEEFDGIFRSGKVVHGRLLSVRYAASDEGTKWGFIISSKHIGNAVQRNAVKRKLRAIVRTKDYQLARDFLIAVVAKAPAATADSADLTTELSGLLKKATLVR